MSRPVSACPVFRITGLISCLGIPPFGAKIRDAPPHRPLFGPAKAVPITGRIAAGAHHAGTDKLRRRGNRHGKRFAIGQWWQAIISHPHGDPISAGSHGIGGHPDECAAGSIDARARW